ncbi:MAG: acyl-CoA desaturase [Nakamurella sp.]
MTESPRVQLADRPMMGPALDLKIRPEPSAARATGGRKPNRAVTEYAALLGTMQDAGLLKRRNTYYVIRLALLLLALGGVWVGFAFIGDSWAQMAIAAVLALVLTQFIFFGHDAAHRQIFQSQRANEITALTLGTLVGGISLSWWNNKHNRHHAAPNQIGKDPDIDPSVVHFYPPATPPKSRVLLFLHEHQGWWFFPLLVVEALNLHAQSVQALATHRDMKRRWIELAMLSVRLGVYPAVLFTFLSPGVAGTFLGVQLAVTGLYLGAAFAASHIGMPVVPQDGRVDFLRRQVLMSRNVSGGRVASFAMGGLNYQIEHHLFPSMARPDLTRARPLVIDYCAENDVAYEEVNIFQAWRIVVRYLNRVGLSARSFQCPMATSLR